MGTMIAEITFDEKLPTKYTPVFLKSLLAIEPPGVEMTDGRRPSAGRGDRALG